MYCASCGREIENSARYCPYCGTKVEPQAGNPNRISEAEKNQPVKELPCTKPERSALERAAEGQNGVSENRRRMRMVVYVASILLWLFAPYMAVDLFTFYQQPTAFQIVTNQVAYLGSLFESLAFWASAACLMTFIFGLPRVSDKNHTAAHIFSILAELLMGIALLQNIFWSLQGLEGYLGVGYWGQAILFLLIIIM